MSKEAERAIACALVGCGYWGRKLLATLVDEEQRERRQGQEGERESEAGEGEGRREDRQAGEARWERAELLGVLAPFYDRDTEGDTERNTEGDTGNNDGRNNSGVRGARCARDARKDSQGVSPQEGESTSSSRQGLGELRRGRFQLVGLYDSDITAAQAARESSKARESKSKQECLRIYPSYAALLADPTVRAIFLATPPKSHFELARLAIQAGKHIFSEKPLSLSAKEGAELYALAARHKVVLHCDHIFLYAPAVQWLRHRRKELGEILAIEARRGAWGKFQQGVGVLWDLSLHDIAILDYVFCGEVEMGVASLSRISLQGELALAEITLQLESRGQKPIPTQITSSWLHPSKQRELLIIGSKQSARYSETSTAKLTLYPTPLHALTATRIQSSAKSQSPVLDSKPSAKAPPNAKAVEAVEAPQTHPLESKKDSSPKRETPSLALDSRQDLSQDSRQDFRLESSSLESCNLESFSLEALATTPALPTVPPLLASIADFYAQILTGESRAGLVAHTKRVLAMVERLSQA